MAKQTRESTKAYYERYHASPEAKKQRAMRNKARRDAIKAGKVQKGDQKEIDHIRPLSKGGSNAKSNLRVVNRKSNRAYKRDRNNKPV